MCAHKYTHTQADMSLIRQCMHTYAFISIIQLFGDPIWSCLSGMHMHTCSIIQACLFHFVIHIDSIVIPMPFPLIMSVLLSLFPAHIDWSCPMHPALYLCPHNPRAWRAKIIVQPQRTDKSHIHCILEKCFWMAISVGAKRKITWQSWTMSLESLFIFYSCIFGREKSFSNISSCIGVFLIQCKPLWCCERCGPGESKC